jgi:hypothetical protein
MHREGRTSEQTQSPTEKSAGIQPVEIASFAGSFVDSWLANGFSNGLSPGTAIHLAGATNPEPIYTSTALSVHKKVEYS